MNDTSSPVQYQVARAPDHAKTVTIKDNGLTASTLSLSKLNLRDTTLPVQTILENNAWGVKIDVDPPAVFPIRVGLMIDQLGGDFVGGGDGARVLEIETGESEKYFYGLVVEDEEDEPDGTLRVSLMAGKSYKIAAGKRQITYAFKDNDDAPIVSFAAPSFVANEDC